MGGSFHCLRVAVGFTTAAFIFSTTSADALLSGTGSSSLPLLPKGAVGGPKAQPRSSVAPFATSIPSGGATSDDSSDGIALTPSTFNLVKNIVGAGVLSLPAGVAAFSNAKTAVVPASALVLALGGLSCYCFALIGRLSAMTGATTYRGAIDGTMGPRSGKLLGAACTLKTGVACLMYSIIIGDITEALGVTVGLPTMVPALAARWKILSVVTAAVLTPLCLMRSFAVLSYTSLLGIVGTLYTAVFMAIRAFDGSYKPDGRFWNALAAKKAALPAFGSNYAPVSAFVLVSMLSTAFIAHYNAPKYYSELKDRSEKRFGILSGLAFGISVAVFSTIMTCGYLTFGSASSGFVLNNYASTDVLATVARGAILASIIFGYPLTFVGFRDGLLELFTGNSNPSWRTKDLSGIAVLAVTTVIATFLRNLGLVSSVAGAVLGSSIIYIFPALAFVAATKSQAKGGEMDPKAKFEYRANQVTAGLGVVLGLIGVTVSFLSA